jgi:RNA polymerase sigma factor, sigma-70 family
MKEEHVIEELKKGNTDIFSELYDIYAEKGLKTAYLITSDKYLAEDILQETFIECCKSINSLKDNSAFKPWFYKILTRLAYKEIKKLKKLVPVENIFENVEGSHYDRYFKDDLINSYINKLDIKHKTVIILYYFNDMSIKEISKITGCYQGTIKSRLNSSRTKLKKLIEKEEVLQ